MAKIVPRSTTAIKNRKRVVSRYKDFWKRDRVLPHNSERNSRGLGPRSRLKVSRQIRLDLQSLCEYVEWKLKRINAFEIFINLKTNSRSFFSTVNQARPGFRILRRQKTQKQIKANISSSKPSSALQRSFSSKEAQIGFVLYWLPPPKWGCNQTISICCLLSMSILSS